MRSVPGRFGLKQYRRLLHRVNLWREDARARGVEIGHKTYRRFSDKPRGTRPCKFKEQWDEMAMLGIQPRSDALELLIELIPDGTVSISLVRSGSESEPGSKKPSSG